MTECTDNQIIQRSQNSLILSNYVPYILKFNKTIQPLLPTVNKNKL